MRGSIDISREERRNTTDQFFMRGCNPDVSNIHMVIIVAGSFCSCHPWTNIAVMQRRQRALFRVTDRRLGFSRNALDLAIFSVDDGDQLLIFVFQMFADLLSCVGRG